jgi:hypothetical protein
MSTNSSNEDRLRAENGVLKEKLYKIEELFPLEVGTSQFFGSPDLPTVEDEKIENRVKRCKETWYKEYEENINLRKKLRDLEEQLGELEVLRNINIALTKIINEYKETIKNLKLINTPIKNQ